MIMLGLSLSSHAPLDAPFPPPPTLPPQVDPVAIAALADGTLEISTNAAGDLTLTISDVTDPASYDGVHDRDVDGAALNEAALASGPQCLVGVRALDDGTPAPGETLTLTPGLWIYDSDATEPTLSYQWYRNGTPIPGETAETYLVQASDGGSILAVIETATDANGTRLALSNAVTVAAPSALALRLGGFQSSGTVTTTPVFDVDTSTCAPGDQIYFAYGPQRYSNAATVNGLPATKVSTDAGNSGAGRLTVFRYTLQAGDIGTAIPVGVTIDITQAHHIFDCWHIAGATPTDSASAQHANSIDPVTVTPTVAGSTNIVLAWGVGTGWSEMAYSGVGEVETAVLTTATSRCMTVGLGLDVPAGSHDITLTPGASGHLGVVAVTLEG